MIAISEALEDRMEGIDQKQNIYKTLSVAMGEIKDRVQAKALLDIMIHSAEELEKSDSAPLNVRVQLENATAAYLKETDHATMLDFLNENIRKPWKFLESKTVSKALVERFIEMEPSEREILRYLLKNTPEETQDIIAEEFSNLIRSEDPVRYTALLEVAQELESSYNYFIIDSIRQACMEIAFKEADSDSQSLCQHVLKLKPIPREIKKIVKQSKRLIVSQDETIQDKGLALLQMINSSGTQSTHGVEEAIDQLTV